jgi:Mg-chelatase subunit ChlD
MHRIGRVGRLAGIAAALAVAGAAALFAQPGRPRVEVAFVLDSTGSMGGLIEGAKQKIWSIANALIARRPSPEVRMGLVSYRDRGDEYVTRLFDLTADIDAVFANLQSFQAEGGGDDEESVNQALREAVQRMGWSPDRSVLKVVFLVGDYPPHMDYRGELRYPDICREAAARDLVINTVQCGGVPETTRVWREIARLAEGSYVALEQSGNMQAVATPYDEEMARLSAEVSRTVVPWGARERQEEAGAKLRKAAAAPAAVAADRAAFNLATGGKAIQGSGDLVEDSAGVDLAKLKPDELPPVMQGMSPEEQQAYLARQRAERAKLNGRLGKLSLLRAAYLAYRAEEQKRAGTGDSFDLKVAEIVSAQLQRKLR